MLLEWEANARSFNSKIIQNSFVMEMLLGNLNICFLASQTRCGKQIPEVLITLPIYLSKMLEDNNKYISFCGFSYFNAEVHT